MQMRWVKIDDFRQIIDYTLKTVKDRHIVSITVVMDVSRHVGLCGCDDIRLESWMIDD